MKELLPKIKPNDKKEKLLQIFFQSILLRKLVSFSVRIENITVQDIEEMKKVGRLLFQSCCLFDERITPSMWVFCNVAPNHCSDLYNSVGFGLGVNSMEGREQKHQSIEKYSRNSTYQNRWPSIFRHEFVQLVFLRENGFDKKKYNTNSVNYVPVVLDGHCLNCALGLENGKCVLCSLIVGIRSQFAKFS